MEWTRQRFSGCFISNCDDVVFMRSGLLGGLGGSVLSAQGTATSVGGTGVVSQGSAVTLLESGVKGGDGGVGVGLSPDGMASNIMGGSIATDPTPIGKLQVEGEPCQPNRGQLSRARPATHGTSARNAVLAAKPLMPAGSACQN